MATSFRERIFTRLDPNEARALVDDIDRRIQEAVDAEEDEAAIERDEEGYSPNDVFDDIDIAFARAAPPTAGEARANANATGYAEQSIVLEPAALDRLASCKSTIVFEYYGRVAEKKTFLAVAKLLFQRVGEAVIESGDGSRLETIESHVQAMKNDDGRHWDRILPFGEPEPLPKRKPVKTRAAKPGEAEAAVLAGDLIHALDGRDPLARAALREGLERATEQVRRYAALLAGEGAQPDARAAKMLGCSDAEAVIARNGLRALLDDGADD